MLIANISDSKTKYSCFEECLEAILLFDETGVIIYCNEVAKSELGDLWSEGCNHITCVFPKVFEWNKKQLHLLEDDLVQKEENCTYYETVAYRSNQTCCPVRLKVAMQVKEDGFLGACYAINRSKEKQALKREKSAKIELDKANNVKNEFLANITHELRTPINGIQGLANNLLETNLSSMQQEHINIILRSCDHMSKMVNDILDFSKITAGKLILEKREFDFEEFIRQTLSIHCAAVQEKGLKVVLNFGSEIPRRVIGDELRLAQILNNLLSNAIKFTNIGQITVEIMNTLQSDTEVELFFFVVDSGIGISKEDMDKLFISFSQVDGSITRRFGGTGLGLVISKRLVELMGGNIHVNSIKGKGSTFSFSVRLGIGSEATRKTDKRESRQFSVDEDGRFSKLGYTTGSILGAENFSYVDEENDDSKEDRIRGVKEILERLSLSVELGNWEKAENFAGVIKNLFLESEQVERKLAFRLELAIRKEDYNTTLERMRELQNLLF